MEQTVIIIKMVSALGIVGAAYIFIRELAKLF